MPMHNNDDRRDGDECPDEYLRLASALLQEDGEFSLCFDL